MMNPEEIGRLAALGLITSDLGIAPFVEEPFADPRLEALRLSTPRLSALGGARIFHLPPEYIDGRGDVPTNPSVVETDLGLLRSIRLVSYALLGAGYVKPGDQPYESRTLLVSETGVLCVVDYEIDGWSSEGSSVRGVEDVRLVEHEGRLFGVGCCRIAPGKWDRCSVVIVTFSSDLRSVENVEPLTWSREAHNEKNWLPWSTPAGLAYVYSWSPRFVVLGGSFGALEAFIDKPGLDGEWRGSAAPIEWGADGFLALVHRAEFFPNVGKIYFHAFVKISADGALTRSREFVFDALTIEFGAGLAHDGEFVCVSWGFRDGEARFRWLEHEKIEGLFSEGLTA